MDPATPPVGLTEKTLEQQARQLGCATDPASLTGLVELGALIQRWNRRKRIVGSADPETLAGVHFADAMALAAHLEKRDGPRLVDVGSGAGLPGLAVALLVPWLEVTLCEPAEKRLAFLHHARRQLGVDVRIFGDTVQALAAEGPAFDQAVSRATFAPEVWVREGTPCLAHRGVLWCMLTEQQRAEWAFGGESHRYEVAGGRQRVLIRLQGPGFT